jgi:hypothetical protein
MAWPFWRCDPPKRNANWKFCREEGSRGPPKHSSHHITLEYEEEPARNPFAGTIEANQRGQELQQLCADLGHALDEVVRLQLCELGPGG